MNKGELVKLMASHSGGTKAEADRALNLVINSVIKALKQGNNINLVGFGSFHIRKREGREGRNPRTGQKMRIAPYNQPVFRAGKKIKEACN
jgi:DNA-binding protein HU-beta